jgi:hypothetical protein
MRQNQNVYLGDRVTTVVRIRRIEVEESTGQGHMERRKCICAPLSCVYVSRSGERQGRRTEEMS